MLHSYTRKQTVDCIQWNIYQFRKNNYDEGKQYSRRKDQLVKEC